MSIGPPRLLIAAMILAAASDTTTARAASKTIDVDTLHQLVTGLGLDDGGDKKSYVQVGDQGSRNYTVTLSPTDSGQSVLIFTKLEDIAPDKAGTAPLQAMLEYNDTHGSYFTINTGEHGKAFYLQNHLLASAVTPKTLRASIDELLASADESAALWSAENWKAGTPDAAKAAPFATRNVMFVSEPTTVFGDYHRRSDNVFVSGEKLLTYMEPTGFGYKVAGNGTFRFGTDVDLEIRTKGGETVAKKVGFATQNLGSHTQVKELFEDFSLSLTGVPPGDYVVTYTLHDIATDGITKAEQPFTIKAAAQP